MLHPMAEIYVREKLSEFRHDAADRPGGRRFASLAQALAWWRLKQQSSTPQPASREPEAPPPARPARAHR